jgi:hypothetical protein
MAAPEDYCPGCNETWCACTDEQEPEAPTLKERVNCRDCGRFFSRDVDGYIPLSRCKPCREKWAKKMAEASATLRRIEGYKNTAIALGGNLMARKAAA